MALNGYVAIEANGVKWTGDVTQSLVGGVDVSADHMEFYELEVGCGVGWERQSARVGSHRAIRPVRCVVRADQTLPLAWQALVQNQTIKAEFKIFDNATEDGGDGTARHRFSVILEGARIVDIQLNSPDSFDANMSTRPPYVTLQLVPNLIRITDQRDSVECEDDWRVMI
ncbi:MAG TPA: hypothetical protein VIL20_09235 [Sandaracinaceae bacterium]